MRRRAGSLLAVGVLTGLALAGGLPALSGPATASSLGAGRVGAQTPSPVSVAITSVNPPYATAHQKVTVQGSLTNASPAPLTGLTIQLRSSAASFGDRDQLQLYADGSEPNADLAVQGALATIRGTVPPGSTVKWTAVLPVHKVQITTFGVYPLAAQAISAAGAPLYTSRTFLPYWPSAKGSARPRRDDIAWLWPLLDRPDQGPCPGLLSNRLAAGVSSSGRLAGLLTAGTSAVGRAANLTWAIDPALLSSADTITRRYSVGGNLQCRQARTRPASKAAKTWLAGLRSAVSSQPAFVTPYADVDIAALTRRGLDADLSKAFQSGRATATTILHHNFTTATGTGGHADAGGTAASQPGVSQPGVSQTSAMAWPADGLANYAMLQNLAAVNGVNTVVLSSSAMPPTDPSLRYTPSAVSSTPNGEGGNMRVLLADATITGVIGSVTAASASPGATFAARQRFLAETAMIAAEAPRLSRAIVVAPPRRWRPPAGLASDLLSETVSAPWLSPVSLASLAATPNAPGRVKRRAPHDAGSQDFGRSLTRRIKAMDRGVNQVESMQVNPDPQLYRAVAGVESAAWRGSTASKRRAWSILRRVTAYVGQQQNGVSIIGPGRDTLGGLKGSVPVSVDNQLGYPVKVRIRLTVRQSRGGERDRNGKLTVLSRLGVIQVPADQIVTKKIRVRAASIGSTTINLSLLSPDGRGLPGSPVTTTVQATQFGTLALTILSAALGILFITSATRAIRSSRTPAGPAPETPDGDKAPTPSDAGEHKQDDGPDNVVHDHAESGEAGTHDVLTEDADDYARVPGWADRG